MLQKSWYRQQVRARNCGERQSTCSHLERCGWVLVGQALGRVKSEGTGETRTKMCGSSLISSSGSNFYGDVSYRKVQNGVKC